jgi:phenylacetate-CoA ligase
MDFLQNRFRIFSYDPGSIEFFCKKLTRAAYLEGYSSMIYETAKIINQKKRDKNFRLKMVKGTSEKIYDYYQSESEKAFGKKIISEYGAAETGLIAFECPYGNMHIAMENVVVEEEDSEILVTNLWSHSFPVIRYSLGDYIKLSENSQCQCGLKHDVIDEVYGRTGELIRGNKLNYPSLSLYYIWKNLAIRHNLLIRGQGIQKEKGEIILNISSELTNREKELVYLEAEKYFSNDISCIINDGQEPIRTNGKLRDFISEIQK